MRMLLSGILAGCLVMNAATFAPADEQAEAKALVDRAIRASGGEAKLVPLKAMTWKGKGTFDSGDNPITFTDEWSVQALDQYRWAVAVEINGNPAQGVAVINGDKGWIKGNDQPAGDMSKDIFSFLTGAFQAVRVAQRLVCLNDKGVQLSLLGELRIDDRLAVGVKAARKDQPDIDLFFDKETLLPVKSTIRLKEPQDQQEATYEFLFGDYQEGNGLQHFTKLVVKRESRQVLEITLGDIQSQENLDNSLFDKP